MAWITELHTSVFTTVRVDRRSTTSVDLDLVRTDGTLHRTVTLSHAELLDLVVQVTVVLADLVDRTTVPLDSFDPPERWIAETGRPDPESKR
jgi:hypothetical protein